jgi:adsorption protein B
VIALIGQVTVGLRQKYSRYSQIDPMADLMSAVEQGRVSQKESELIWTYFVSRQIMLGEVLQTLGHIDAAAFSAILLQHSSTDLRLGDFLVRQDIITQETLDHAIDLQMNIQPDIETAIVHFQSHQRGFTDHVQVT